MTANIKQEVLYANLSAENEPCVMESICPSCEETGKTTILLTKIPFFMDIIIISFTCDQCGERNSEVQFGGKIADQGVIANFRMETPQDLNRECIKSEHGSFKIPALEFEIPANKKGMINTIEGFLTNTIKDLNHLQPLRKVQDPENAEKIDQFLYKLQRILDGQEFPCMIEIQDPSGNSYILNPQAPKEDPQVKITKYNRTLEETEKMGYSQENQKLENEINETQQQLNQQTQQVEEQKNQEQPQHTEQPELSAHKHDFNKPIVGDKQLREEALSFTATCHICHQEGEQKMCTISIPYFKDILIMSFNCQHCGGNTNEVKSGGEITEHGKTITLYADGVEDLKRDLFKSETAGISIPELELELAHGTLGGVYTTVEGVLQQVLTHLKETNPFVGDSDTARSNIMNKLFISLKNYMTGEIKFTLIINDLLDNSFLQNPYYPNADPRVKVEIYHRTAEDNDFLGIDQMKTEGYEQ